MAANSPETQKLSEFATVILRGIAERTVDPDKISVDDRRLCVQYMLHERKWTQMEISEILHVNPATITRDKQLLLSQNAWMLTEIDNRNFALELIHTAAIASASLFRKKHPYEAWKVEKELVESLQSLGYISKEPIKLEGQLSLLEVLKLSVRSPEGSTDDGGNGSGFSESEQSFLRSRDSKGLEGT